MANEVIVQMFKEMLTVQDGLNQMTIGPAWAQNEDIDWFLAISQECAEAVDHIGWKWWAKQEPNIPAAQMEVVDILHFVLSAEISLAPVGTSLGVVAALLEEEYQHKREYIELDGAVFRCEDSTVVELFHLLSGLASVGRTSIGALFRTANRLCLTSVQVCELYQKKATLNLFRQRNGYKQGTYIKHWASGLEDNDFIPRLSADIDWRIPGAGEQLYKRLEAEYAIVQRTAGRRH